MDLRFDKLLLLTCFVHLEAKCLESLDLHAFLSPMVSCCSEPYHEKVLVVGSLIESKEVLEHDGIRFVDDNHSLSHAGLLFDTYLVADIGVPLRLVGTL